jgi:hypothetical protein
MTQEHEGENPPEKTVISRPINYSEEVDRLLARSRMIYPVGSCGSRPGEKAAALIAAREQAANEEREREAQ